MGLGWILFGLNGRLNRKPYWIASIVFLVLLIAVALTGVVIGARMMNEAFLAGGSVEAATAVMNYPAIIAGILVLYPATAIMVKRFHDLGRTGKWALLLLIPAVGKMATDFIGVTGQELTFAQMDIDIASGQIPSYFEALQKQMAAELRIKPAEFAVDVFNFIVTIWFFIWLGFFRGTVGPNHYGPDPLEAAATT